MYMYMYMCVYIYIYYIYIYKIGQTGKSVKPTSTPTPTPKFWEIFKICTSKCSKNTNTLPSLISFLFSSLKLSKLLTFPLENTLFQERFLNNLYTQLKKFV